MQAQDIERILREKLDVDEVFVEGENAHFNVVVVSNQFENMGKVKQQQMIYAPLMEHIAQNTIHALSIKTYTVAKWKQACLLNGIK